MGFIEDIIDKSAEVATQVTIVVVQAAITATVVLFSRIVEGLREAFDN